MNTNEIEVEVEASDELENTELEAGKTDKELSPEEAAELEAQAIIAGENVSDDKGADASSVQKETDKELEDFIEPSEMSQLDFSDVEDDVDCSVDLDVRKRVIEAVLFVSDKPVGLTTLMAAFGEEDYTVCRKYNIIEP